jgi:hypothetical protein
MHNTARLLLYRIGGAKVLMAGVALWSFGTLIAPPAAHLGIWALCATRVLVSILAATLKLGVEFAGHLNVWWRVTVVTQQPGSLAQPLHAFDLQLSVLTSALPAAHLASSGISMICGLATANMASNKQYRAVRLSTWCGGVLHYD